jgi:hypothetical protein
MTSCVGAMFQLIGRSRDLSYADLSNANLSGAGLLGAMLSSVVLDGVDFERANVGGTSFVNVNLSSCSGLDSIRHDGPSSLGVDSIIRPKGRIPEIFLRGVGLPDEWITYIPSLVGDGIQFFSCFISYSSLDKLFAVRLHDALQAKGETRHAGIGARKIAKSTGYPLGTVNAILTRSRQQIC